MEEKIKFSSNCDVLACHHRCAAEVVLTTAQTFNASEWAYLGDDFTQLMHWQKIFGSKLKRVSLGNRINDAAWALRDAYIDWVALLGKPYGRDLGWWTSLVADKNTLVTPLFLHLCYLKVCETLCSQSAGSPIVLIVQGSSLLDVLVRALRRKGKSVRVCRGGLIVRLSEAARRYLWFAGSWGLWFLRVLRFQFAARIQARPLTSLRHWRPPERLAIIHTCVDDACMLPDGRFDDRFFPGLEAWLKDQGYTVWVIPFLYNIQRDLGDALRWLRNSSTTFLLSEDFCSPLAYASAVFTVMRQLAIPCGPVRFRGWDIRPLIDDLRWRQARNTDNVRFLAYDALFSRLHQKGVRPELFIDKFENMPKEKPAIAYIRRLFPKCTILGFQHASLPPMMLKYTTRRQEFFRGLFPDYVIANGPWFANRLAADGVPAERLRTGPSLRSSFITANSDSVVLDAQWKSAGQQPCVLVTLSLARALTMELLNTVLPALQNGPWKVLIKPHPMTDRRVLLRALGYRELPAGMHWVDGPLHKWLSQVHCLVATGSATIMEAAAFGVPVVVVGRECGLEINPIGWWAETFPDLRPTYGVNAVRQKVAELLVSSGKPQRRLKHILRQCYWPVSHDNLRAFLPRP